MEGRRDERRDQARGDRYRSLQGSLRQAGRERCASKPAVSGGRADSRGQPCNAASNSSGRSTIIMWPAPRSTTVREFGSAAASALPAFAGVIMSRSPRMSVVGHRDLRGGGQRILIGVAGGEVVEQHAGPALFEHALGAGVHPQSRREAAAEFGLKAEAPDRDHVDGCMIVGLRGLEQIGPDRHGGRGADQAERRNLCRMPRGGLQRNQRSHGMTDQPCAWRRRPRRAARRSSRPSRRWCAAARRKSGRGRANPAPARHSRDARTIGCARPRPYDRSRRRAAARWSAASESNSRPPVATKVSMPFTDNCIAQAFCEIRSAWPRSSMMSAADSMPTDSRTSSSPMPAALSWAASIC